MLFTAKTRTALRAAIALVEAGAVPGGRPLRIQDLAAETKLPRPYLAKVATELAAAGLIEAARGRGGGVRLARRPSEISLAEVIEAVERVDGLRRCILEDRPCSEMESCPLHRVCKKIREEILETTTLDATLAAYDACRRLRGAEAA